MGRLARDIWAVVPVKPFIAAKSRLALPAAQRATIARDLFRHVCGVVGDVLPRHRTIVVSRDGAVLAMARAAGMRALREEPHDDLNDALGSGAAYAQERGAAGVLSVFTDLPDLGADDLEAMIAAFTATNLVIAPDVAGSGTNAMLMAPRLIPYRHGPDSFWHHLAAAREGCLDLAVVARPGLMQDLDTPAQLGQWLARANAAGRRVGHFHA